MARGRGDGGTSADLAVIGIALAGIVTVADSETDWTLWDTMIGALLLLVLYGYASGRYAAQREAVAFAAVAGFAVVIAVAPLIVWALPNDRAEQGAIAVLWIVASLAAIPIDRRWFGRGSG